MLDLMSGTLLIGSMYTAYEIIERLDIGEIVASRFKTYDEYSLVLGYRRKGPFKIPISVSMLVCPHLLIAGLSSNGKTKCVEYAIKDKSNVVILNAFSEDFKSCKCRRIIGNDKILKFLTGLLENPYKRKTPLYVVIDELLVLCADKKITKAITDLLATARHWNIFIIGVSQVATKNDIGFKQLFNSRCTFRQVDSSSYSTVLGTTVEEKLKKREFLLYSDDVYKGRTYDV